jgi:hypothetical protein
MAARVKPAHDRFDFGARGSVFTSPRRGEVGERREAVSRVGLQVYR